MVNNSKKIFDTQLDNSNDDGDGDCNGVANNKVVTSLHGIRVLSMFWIILGHLMLLSNPYVCKLFSLICY